MNILILKSDERGIKPPALADLFMVFRMYNRRDLYDEEKIFPIPCGYANSFDYDFNYSQYEGELNKKPLIDRELDIFYSGQKAPNRMTFIHQLQKLEKDFNSLVNVTSRFAAGYVLEEYYQLMSNTKVALVPNGAVVPESFRYFEAFECNCITITSYPIRLPQYQHWYYEDSPAIFLEDWRELKSELIKPLLRKEKLEELFELNRQYFKKKISVGAVADYMLTKIKNK